MNKKATSIGVVALTALAGTAIVWSAIQNDDSKPGGAPANGPTAGETAQQGGEAVRGSGDTAGMRRNNLPNQATVIDQVVVPIPSEIFSVLDKLGKPQWREVMRPQSASSRARGGTEETALLLGYVIAEGFVAVEAEDAQKVKDIGRSVLNLSEAIGVRKAVIRRSNAIMEAADHRDWPRARKEFDGALSDVKEAMRELNSETTADLVSLGGWIRGTDALASVVQTDYKPDSADLLHQPGLIDHFSGKLASLPKRSQELPIVNSVQQGLTEIRPLMGTGNEPVSKDAVAKIGQTTTNLVQLIEGKRGQ